MILLVKIMNKTSLKEEMAMNVTFYWHIETVMIEKTGGTLGLI